MVSEGVARGLQFLSLTTPDKYGVCAFYKENSIPEDWFNVVISQYDGVPQQKGGSVYPMTVINRCFTNPACYAFISHCSGFFKEDSTLLIGLPRRNDVEVMKNYYSWVLSPEVSPWRSLFTQDFPKLMQPHEADMNYYEVPMSVFLKYVKEDGQKFRRLLNFMTAVRAVNEHPGNIRAWHVLTSQHGVDAYEAYIICAGIQVDQQGKLTPTAVNNGNHWPFIFGNFSLKKFRESDLNAGQGNVNRCFSKQDADDLVRMDYVGGHNNPWTKLGTAVSRGQFGGTVYEPTFKQVLDHYEKIKGQWA